MKARSQYLWLAIEEFGTIPEAQFRLLVWHVLFGDRSGKQKGKGEKKLLCMYISVCVYKWIMSFILLPLFCITWQTSGIHLAVIICYEGAKRLSDSHDGVTFEWVQMDQNHLPVCTPRISLNKLVCTPGTWLECEVHPLITNKHLVLLFHLEEKDRFRAD